MRGLPCPFPTPIYRYFPHRYFRCGRRRSSLVSAIRGLDRKLRAFSRRHLQYTDSDVTWVYSICENPHHSAYGGVFFFCLLGWGSWRGLALSLIPSSQCSMQCMRSKTLRFVRPLIPLPWVRSISIGVHVYKKMEILGGTAMFKAHRHRPSFFCFWVLD